MSDNFISIVGNLTRDPELRFTATGKPVASCAMAVARRYQVNGEWQEKTSFFNFSVWNKLAENLAASASKGTRVAITGYIEQREYVTKDGDKRTSFDVTADTCSIDLKWGTAEFTKGAAGSNNASNASSSQDLPVDDDSNPFG
jgi:single-strand DNA-binding protein